MVKRCPVLHHDNSCRTNYTAFWKSHILLTFNNFWLIDTKMFLATSSQPKVFTLHHFQIKFTFLEPRKSFKTSNLTNSVGFINHFVLTKVSSYVQHFWHYFFLFFFLDFASPSLSTNYKFKLIFFLCTAYSVSKI